MADLEPQFTWDSRKNAANQRKHGVPFEAAVRVFDDPFQLSWQDREVDGEPRWQTIGIIPETQLIVVAYVVTDSDDQKCIRIISARKATPLERKAYGKQIENR